MENLEAQEAQQRQRAEKTPLTDKLANPVESPVVTRLEAAAYLKCGLTNLDHLDIPRIQISARRFVYAKKDLNEWLESQRAKGMANAKEAEK